MTSTVLPVPAILSILSDSNYLLDQTADGQMQRAKKRRLDHLSWEEKIQRKKLKNRVAAQTSRDRKKAKVEQMETAIQQLFNKNETLIGECDRLRATNERLLAENSELHRNAPLPMPEPDCRVRAREWINRVPPSAERNERLLSSGSSRRAEAPPVEDSPDLPSLPELLDQLESDTVDLNALEHFTQTLLEDIARDLENAAQKTTDQDQEAVPDKMVGAPAKQLEPSGGAAVDPDISQYLLLHHNYAKSRPAKEAQPPRRLKALRPKPPACAHQPLLLRAEVAGNVSPKSDMGYESLGSPLSSCELDSWDQSVSGLFPTLF
ncbi:hypothetical protein YQE_07762, partial [Dendroctonus ponderosae]